jgi:hypothetical protein
MSVEPEVVDTNVLVYALDADAPQHAANSRLRRRRTASSGYDRPLRFSAQPNAGGALVGRAVAHGPRSLHQL